jgi:hypothetical protein
MAKSVNLAEYETVTEATKRLGAKSLSTVSAYARAGKVRSVRIQEGAVSKLYVSKKDLDKMIVDFALRQKAAADLKQGVASTIQEKFSRWGARSAAPTPTVNPTAASKSGEKFWESSDFQEMLRRVVGEAVETKIRELF